VGMAQGRLARVPFRADTHAKFPAIERNSGGGSHGIDITQRWVVQARGRTISPSLTLSALTHSSSASGMDAADVFPYSAMLETTFSAGTPNLSAAESMMRWFACQEGRGGVDGQFRAHV
jgi:hypothetical protein